MRKTKNICTIGPATTDVAVLVDMIDHGMDCARLNFSHGSHEEHKMRMDNIRRASQITRRSIPILLDTKGPEIRFGTFPGGGIELLEGEAFAICCDGGEADEHKYGHVTFAELWQYVSRGSTLLVDDGKLELKVKEVRGETIWCTVVTGGYLRDHKGINIPNVPIPMAYLSQADRDDLRFGVEQDVDFIAMSFVRSRADVLAVRDYLKELSAGPIRLIAKIENNEGLADFDGILEEADGIMVARGDMGVELPFQCVPQIQKDLIHRCFKAGKLVITATQMLESMISSARPTRAEVSDVANAVYDGTGVVMLSGESAMGSYPVEAVSALSAISEESERHIDYYRDFLCDLSQYDDVNVPLAYGAYYTALHIGAAAIVVTTHSGRTARLVSAMRPNCRIIACTDEEKTERQMQLSWGVEPVLVPHYESAKELSDGCIAACRRTAGLGSGDRVILIGSQAMTAEYDFIQIITL